MNGETVSTRERRGQGAMSLAERINLLFDRVRRADGKPFTNEQVALALTESTGKSVDRAYISALRTHAKDNPTRRLLQGLADFFDVSPAFFFDDEQSIKIAEQIELATALRDERTRALAVQLLRAVEPDDVPLVADVVRAVSERPAIRDVLALMLSLGDADLQMAGDVLRSVLNRREVPASE